MLRDDYIMRAIEDLVAALGRVVAAKGAEDYEAAGVALQTASHDLTGLGIDAVARMSVGGIVELFEADGVLEVERAAMAARLVMEYGELLERRGYPEDARPCYVKAFCLYDELGEELDGDPGEGLDAAPDRPGLADLGSHRGTFTWLVEKLESLESLES